MTRHEEKNEYAERSEYPRQHETGAPVPERPVEEEKDDGEDDEALEGLDDPVVEYYGEQAPLLVAAQAAGATSPLLMGETIPQNLLEKYAALSSEKVRGERILSRIRVHLYILRYADIK